MFCLKKFYWGYCSQLLLQSDIANNVFTPEWSQSNDIALCPIDGSMNKVK